MVRPAVLPSGKRRLGSRTLIILDTHIWIWWVHGDSNLPFEYTALLDAHADAGLGVSAISCWEVAKLVELGRLHLHEDLDVWLKLALGYPGVRLIELSPQIAIESTRLPGEFHRDPADQIIVATARVLDAPLATVDQRILAYPNVRTFPR